MNEQGIAILKMQRNQALDAVCEVISQADANEQALRREIEELKAKIVFLETTETKDS